MAISCSIGGRREVYISHFSATELAYLNFCLDDHFYSPVFLTEIFSSQVHLCYDRIASQGIAQNGRFFQEDLASSNLAVKKPTRVLCFLLPVDSLFSF